MNQLEMRLSAGAPMLEGDSFSFIKDPSTSDNLEILMNYSSTIATISICLLFIFFSFLEVSNYHFGFFMSKTVHPMGKIFPQVSPVSFIRMLDRPRMHRAGKPVMGRKDSDRGAVLKKVSLWNLDFFVQGTWDLHKKRQCNDLLFGGCTYICKPTSTYINTSESMDIAPQHICMTCWNYIPGKASTEADILLLQMDVHLLNDFSLAISDCRKVHDVFEHLIFQDS